MHDPNERLNEPQFITQLEGQLRRLEPLPPPLDRDALMYRAGWAAALAEQEGSQQAGSRRAWLAPATAGFLAATAAGLLALVLWRTAFLEPADIRISETPVASEQSAPPAPENDIATSKDGERVNPGGRDIAALPAPPDGMPGVILDGGLDQPTAAGEIAIPRSGGEAWAVVSTSLAERHGIRWDDPWQQVAEGPSGPAAVSPPPTVMQLMRETGTWSDRRDAPMSYPLMRFMETT